MLKSELSNILNYLQLFKVLISDLPKLSFIILEEKSFRWNQFQYILTLFIGPAKVTHYRCNLAPSPPAGGSAPAEAGQALHIDGPLGLNRWLPAHNKYLGDSTYNKTLYTMTTNPIDPKIIILPKSY